MDTAENRERFEDAASSADTVEKPAEDCTLDDPSAEAVACTYEASSSAKDSLQAPPARPEAAVSVHVSVRLRPLLPHEVSAGNRQCLEARDKQLFLGQRSFQFDNVFGPTASQASPFALLPCPTMVPQRTRRRTSTKRHVHRWSTHASLDITRRCWRTAKQARSTSVTELWPFVALGPVGRPGHSIGELS
jgi:hypothetical protein